jgi:hypothetical protein
MISLLQITLSSIYTPRFQIRDTGSYSFGRRMRQKMSFSWSEEDSWRDERQRDRFFSMSRHCYYSQVMSWSNSRSFVGPLNRSVSESRGWRKDWTR